MDNNCCGIPQAKRPCLDNTVGLQANCGCPLLQHLHMMLPWIVSYLEPKERCAFAVTSKDALDQVERYCQKVLKVIQGPGNCNTDDSFAERIRRHTSRTPYRLLVERAKTTYLNTIGDDSSVDMEMSPAETKMAIATFSNENSSTAIKVFDLASKTCIAKLDLEEVKTTLALRYCRPGLSYFRFHGEEKMLLCVGDRDIILLWNLAEGCCSLLVSHNNSQSTTVADAMSLSEDEIVFIKDPGVRMGPGEEPVIEARSLDIRTPLEHSKLQLNIGNKREVMSVQFFRTRGEKKWLAVWAQNRDQLCRYALHLYNLDTMEQTATWLSPTEGSQIFISVSETSCKLCFLGWTQSSHVVHAFDLDETTGNLSFSRSFKVHYFGNNSGEARILALTASQEVLVEVDYGAAGNNLLFFPLIPRSFRELGGDMIALPTRELRSIPRPRKTSRSEVHNELYIHIQGRYSIYVVLDKEPQGIM